MWVVEQSCKRCLIVLCTFQKTLWWAKVYFKKNKNRNCHFPGRSRNNEIKLKFFMEYFTARKDLFWEFLIIPFSLFLIIFYHLFDNFIYCILIVLTTPIPPLFTQIKFFICPNLSSSPFNVICIGQLFMDMWNPL